MRREVEEGFVDVADCSFLLCWGALARGAEGGARWFFCEAVVGGWVDDALFFSGLVDDVFEESDIGTPLTGGDERPFGDREARYAARALLGRRGRGESGEEGVFMGD